jgi:exopolysaccharide biosynthesis protein
MPDAPDYIIRTRRQTTRNFFRDLKAKKINVVAAVNATPWSPWRAPFTHTYADRMGFLVSDGTVVMPPDGKRPSLIVTADGKVDLATITADADISNIKQAVSGFGFVLKNGKSSGGNKALAPRTGYGLSKDKRYLYIFVADGRQPKYSMGLTHREVGDFLSFLGAYNGLNMDGGGSSTMIIRKGKKEQMLNHQPRNGERTVGASLGISLNK